MWGKIILLIILISLLGITSWFLYQNMPGEPEHFEIRNIQATKNENINYPAAKMFYPNMRFNHANISYYIETSCSQQRTEIMKEAFLILQNKTKVISFFPEIKENADILVGCSQDYITEGENTFRAGEGGPTRFINTTLYYVIIKGKVLLYKEEQCDYPIVELHELLHVFGFDHSENPQDIMYNYSDCEQRINNEVIKTLNSLYSKEPLPDLYFSEINATKRGRYLDFKVIIRNKGLEDAPDTNLVVLSENNEEIKRFEMNSTDYGTGRILYAKNLMLPSRSTEKIKFFIDPENNIEEIYENNNEIVLTIK
jgi:hypothetical protein